MRNIFLSYARRDAKLMRRIFGTLHSAGYKVWVDTEESRIGNYWRKEIAIAIQKSEVFILLISSHSMSSPEVQRELNLAGDDDKPILPIMLEELDIPEQMKYLLAGLHWTNLAEGYEKGIARLLKALEEMEQSTPENYEWGVHASDFKQLINLLATSNKSAVELLVEFGNKLAELSEKAYQRLIDKLKEHNEKEKKWQEENRQLIEQSREVRAEMVRMKKIAPQSLAYQVLSKRYRELLEDELLLTKSHSVRHKDFDSIMKDMDSLMKSKKSYWEFIEDLMEAEKRALNKLNIE